MENIKRTAVIGNYLPRLCGIATFTTNFVRSIQKADPAIECFAVAMNDTPDGYKYPLDVKFEINQDILSEYDLAAEYMNFQQIDLVSLQHEFGIYGGHEGEYILHLLEKLRMPVVTTLHTILEKPTDKQHHVLTELARQSSRVVVMAEKAFDFLTTIYNVPADKIRLIQHGIPDMPFVDSNFYKDQFGMEGKKVILTFGLLSKNKGIEYMIKAMPGITEKNPDVVYIILGATHPNVKKNEGEEYRHSLERLSRQLGVEDKVVFVNRFVDIKELREFLGAADIYVTPYLAEAQITSGTLAYALGVGKATVSTPYWYARELLSDDRGILVDFRDEMGLTSAINKLLEDEVERNSMRKKAYLYSRNAIWPQVANDYISVFNEVKEERSKHPTFVFNITDLAKDDPPLPEVNIDHLITLTDDTGMLQHATFTVPDREHGYCVDDNSRALLLTSMMLNLSYQRKIIPAYQKRYLSFIQNAYNADNGWFRNFLSFDRRWLEDKGSQESHARTLWGLGVTCALSHDDNILALSSMLFHKGLLVMDHLLHPRAIAFALLGIHAYLARFCGDIEVRRIRDMAVAKLYKKFKNKNNKKWPWYEDTLTYANARVPHALLLSGHWSGNQAMTDKAFHLLDWLIGIHFPDHVFLPVGNRGWYVKGRERPVFDQQPIEAFAMIDAALVAYRMSSEKKYLHVAWKAFDWFVGQNALGMPLYDYKTGGCRDGLTPDGLNLNQGAESTLSWLISLILMHSYDANKSEIQFLTEIHNSYPIK
jgi:glycosyltransferase involved in cell wall biosynthesis